jgi:hypothetical protein
MGNYQAQSNQRFLSTHNTAEIHNGDYLIDGGRTQPISTCIMAANIAAATLRLIYMEKPCRLTLTMLGFV